MTRMLCLALVLSSPPAAGGQLYRWVDDAGQVHFTDRPTEAAGPAEEEKPYDDREVVRALQADRPQEAIRLLNEGPPRAEFALIRSGQRLHRCRRGDARCEQSPAATILPWWRKHSPW